RRRWQAGHAKADAAPGHRTGLARGLGGGHHTGTRMVRSLWWRTPSSRTASATPSPLLSTVVTATALERGFWKAGQNMVLTAPLSAKRTTTSSRLRLPTRTSAATTPSAAGAGVGAGGGWGGGWVWKAPTSMLVAGRGSPRWSVVGTVRPGIRLVLTPWPRAGLPGSRAMGAGGPPLSCSGPSSGLVLNWLPPRSPPAAMLTALPNRFPWAWSITPTTSSWFCVAAPLLGLNTIVLSRLRWLPAPKVSMPPPSAPL